MNDTKAGHAPESQEWFLTPDGSGLAQFLTMRRHRCVCLIGDDRKPYYRFAETARLKTDVADYETAIVSAVGFAAAGNIVRKLTREARFRQAEQDRRLVAQVAGMHGRQTVTMATSSQPIEQRLTEALDSMRTQDTDRVGAR